MSQVFSADAVNGPTNTTILTTAETTAGIGNFLSPPFQNAKAVVWGTVYVTVGAGTTQLTIRLRRNPNAENVIVAAYGNITVAAGNDVILSIPAADALAGPGPVQYALTVQQTGATGNGTIVGSSIVTMLISG